MKHEQADHLHRRREPRLPAEGDHPSFLALDLYAVGAEVDETLRRHLEVCDRCQRHLDEHRRPLPVPGWAVALDRRRKRPLGWSLGGVALAAAMGLWLVAPVEEPSYSTTRGSPAVAVFVRQENQVGPWDGETPVRVGDGIRLQVAPVGYTHVGVFVGDRTTPSWLYRGPIPSEDGLLPKAWEVTGDGATEVLTVVLAVEPVREDHLGAAAEEEGTVWLRTIVLPKASVGATRRELER